MTPTLEHVKAVLTRTPGALNAMLRDLPPEWTDAPEGDGTWSVRGVIGHLIHGEHTDWIPRARRLLDHGESVPFDPFDREGHAALIQTHTLPELLDLFAAARRDSLASLDGLNVTAADLERTGRHQVLGRVTLAHLLATWAAHDLTHIHQVSRIMAHQCRDAVGPWERFLGVLHCNGHSE